MPIVSVPKTLRDKLGDDGSDALVTLLKESQEEQKNNLFELLEERFARRIENSESRLRGEIHQLSEKMDARFAEVQRQFGEIQKQFGEVQRQFGEMQKQFWGIQKQITSQTRWLIALAGFLGVTLKLIDKFFP